jgi:hypothetical protein
MTEKLYTHTQTGMHTQNSVWTLRGYRVIDWRGAHRQRG